MTANEDFLFAQEAQALGFVTEPQVREAFDLQRRMSEDLQLDERLGVILVKRGYMAEDQARRVYARIEPKGAKPGQITGYRLIEVVGRGAMGTVYRAIHLGLNREVALKILRQDLAGDRTQVERLKAEAAMLASLDHPNIVRALDAGESNGFPYVAMEFVEGETLRDRIRQNGPLPEREALRITRDLADALERARRKGVVHRDVKPGNVLIARDGTPKLMDLGLAKGPIDLGLTQHGATVGTPQYIAPEQAIDPRKADTRSDIYALGATLYAMLTGLPPFDGQTLAEILTKVLYEMPVPVRSLRPEVSPEAGYLVERMMLRDPSLRYATPALVVADIDHLIQGNSILPQGFSGNWEAYLLRKRVRRYAVSGTLAVVSAVAIAFGVRMYQESYQRTEARVSLEAEIRDEMLDPPLSTDTRLAVERRAKRAEELATAARRFEPSNLAEIETRLKALRLEVKHLDVLDVAVASALAEERARRFAAAHDVLSAFLDKVRGDEPARKFGLEARSALETRSDGALFEARRAEFLARPGSLDDVRATHDRWAAAVATTFAPTGIDRPERFASAAAAEAARALAVEVGDLLQSVAPDVIASRIALHQFADLHRDLVDAERRAAEELERRRPRLAGGSYFAAVDLERLVHAPFLAAATDAASRVMDEAARVIAESERLEGEGATPKALETLLAFVDAAGKEQAYPQAAERVETKRSELDYRTRESLKAADAALSDLLEDLVRYLRRADLPGYAAAVAEAQAKPDVYRPVSAFLTELEVVPDAFRRRDDRAMSGLVVRAANSKTRVLDPVLLRDGSVVRKWDIQSVDASARTFVVVASPGGVPQPPRTHALLELAAEEILRLAGLSNDPKDKDDLYLRALDALSTLPEPPPDFYLRQAQLKAVADLFERAGQRDAILARWVGKQLERLQDEIRDQEARAQKALESADQRFNEGNYDLARKHYGDLKAPPFVYTQLAKGRAALIDQQLAIIVAHTTQNEFERYFVGAKIMVRPGPTSDTPDLDVRYDFNTFEQLENVLPGVGLARLVAGGAGRVLTPEALPNDSSLLVLPGNEGELVKDAPVAWEAWEDPSVDRSIAFNFWPRQPSFLGIGLDGVSVGVLSLDPQGLPFPPEAPLLERERQKPFNYYGRGRGVFFRAAPEMGDPTTWSWGDAHQGRHFQPKDIAVKERHEQLAGHWFLFDPNHEKPYRVRFTHSPEQGRVALFVDEREVWYAQGPEYRTPKPSGRIEILSFTTCMIDDVVITGRVAKPWLDRMRAKSRAKPVSEGVPPPTGKPAK